MHHVELYFPIWHVATNRRCRPRHHLSHAPILLNFPKLLALKLLLLARYHHSHALTVRHSLAQHVPVTISPLVPVSGLVLLILLQLPDTVFVLWRILFVVDDTLLVIHSHHVVVPFLPEQLLAMLVIPPSV